MLTEWIKFQTVPVYSQPCWLLFLPLRKLLLLLLIADDANSPKTICIYLHLVVRTVNKNACGAQNTCYGTIKLNVFINKENHETIIKEISLWCSIRNLFTQFNMLHLFRRQKALRPCDNHLFWIISLVNNPFNKHNVQMCSRRDVNLNQQS